MQKSLKRLTSEQTNRASANLDRKSALEIAKIINAADAEVAPAVKRALPQIARAIDAISDALRSGGRLIYVGAGTSGRLAALDAAECPPTFNTDPKTVQLRKSVQSTLRGGRLSNQGITSRSLIEYGKA